MPFGRTIGASFGEALMADSDPLDSALRDVKELEQFLFAFLGALAVHPPKPGEDVSHRVQELGLQAPAAWTGEPILWVGRTDDAPAGADPRPRAAG